jgi:hypothetical protein
MDRACKVRTISNVHYCSDALVKKMYWTYRDGFRLKELCNGCFHCTIGVMQTDMKYFIDLLSYSRAVTEGCYVPFSLN